MLKYKGLLKNNKNMTESSSLNKNCPKCQGTGRVKEKDGTIHICFDCLNAGNLDQHDKKFVNHGIKL